MINYVKHKDIDQEKWDAMVKASPVGEVFSFSWYLNTFCTWDALLLNNYEAGIALPVKRRLLFKQIYQPTFIQKCVWTGKFVPEELEKLLCEHSAKTHINTNFELAQAHPRANYILDLRKPYEEIKQRFSTNVKRNLKKNEPLELSDCPLSVAWDLYTNTYGHLYNAVTIDEFNSLKRLIENRPEQFAVKCMLYEDQPIAFGLWVINESHKRLHYLMGAPNLTGKKLSAMTYLHNEMIKTYAGAPWIYDFEGSTIPSVATFYKKFGTSNEPFYEHSLTNGFLVAFLEKVYKTVKKS